jgi:hypothetical protein
MRFALGSVVSFRLGMMENIDAFILSPTAGHPKDIKVPHPFHVNSKKMAEDLAVSFIYCVMDDDQLPIADDFFEVGRATLDAHPEYGMLAGFPLEYGLHGQPYAHRTEDVIEAHSIGCPYFVRRGTLTFPDGELRQYDGILSKVVTDQGLKTGFARKCVYNHLGYGFSQIGYTD